MILSNASTTSNATPIAQYFLARSIYDGDYISNLKMQKLVYYAHAAGLVCLNRPIRETQFEAWLNGPVDPLLYQSLKVYGSRPIDEAFLDGQDLDDLAALFSNEERQLLDNVYESYGLMTAFELVVRTHAEAPWQEARKGLAPTASSAKPISDDVIRATYSPDDFEAEPYTFE